MGFCWGALLSVRRLDDESVVRAPTRRSLAAFRLCTTDPARCTYASPAPRPQTPCSLLDLCGRRDLYYSSAGGYEQALVASELPHWLGAFTSQPIVRGAPSRRRLRSRAVTRLCNWARGWLPILAAEESGRHEGDCHRGGQRRGGSRRVQALVSCWLPRARAARCRARGVGGGLRVLVLSWKYISYGPIVSVWVPRSL